MLTFFRKLRYRLLNSNQFGSYLKYAFGEILLVVAGILIALQVNNWNEGNNLRKSQNNYLKQLSADVDTMQLDYKTALQFGRQYVEASKEVFNEFKSCKISPGNKAILDQLLLNYNNLGVLFQIRDTYDEMLSANLLANLGDPDLKSKITEFFSQRDAMMIFMEEYKEDLNLHSSLIEEHVVFEFDSNNQPIVVYNPAELCGNSEFSNAIFKYIKYREIRVQMSIILEEKLRKLQELFEVHKKDW